MCNITFKHNFYKGSSRISMYSFYCDLLLICSRMFRNVNIFTKTRMNSSKKSLYDFISLRRHQTQQNLLNFSSQDTHLIPFWSVTFQNSFKCWKRIIIESSSKTSAIFYLSRGAAHDRRWRRRCWILLQCCWWTLPRWPDRHTGCGFHPPLWPSRPPQTQSSAHLELT